MKYTLLLYFIFHMAIGQTIDPRYDNFEGEALVFKLIEDGQWDIAESTYAAEKKSIQGVNPATFHLLNGHFALHKKELKNAERELTQSLNLKFSHQALDLLLSVFTLTEQYEAGLRLLQQTIKNRVGKKTEAEVDFLKKVSQQRDLLSSSIRWLDSALSIVFDFPLFKLFVQLALRSQLLHEAKSQALSALLSRKINSPEQILTITEEFILAGADSELQEFLEAACIFFPKSDLIKLNLAQVLFKKDQLLSALNTLSEMKSDDGLISVQIELMNLMQVRSYSLFHRMNLNDDGLHLKNWLVYFINNEAWSLLYSLNPKLQGPQPLPWMSDELNYALAYSAISVNDSRTMADYSRHIKGPQWEEKKTKLLKSVAK